MTDITNIVNMSIYDLSTSIASGFSSIAVYTATAQDGVFSEITTSATRVTLISTTEYYTYSHTATGISDNWYKFKLFNGTSSATNFQTSAFKGNTSDLTEELRNILNDIDDNISNYRYTIKELRRFVKIALKKLQSTPYRNRFKASADGIITPSMGNMDEGIALIQCQIEVINSQLMKAADTNILFSDGRGSFNNRTHEALVAQLKFLKSERNELISNYNKILGNTAVRCEMWTQMSGVST